MRSNLVTRLNALEASRGERMVVVFPFDCFYQAAQPTRMTLKAFKARAAGGLASFYAEVTSTKRGSVPEQKLHDLPTMPEGGETEPITAEFIANQIEQAARLISSSLTALLRNGDGEATKTHGNALIDEHSKALSARFSTDYDKTRAVVAAAVDELLGTG